MISGRPLAPPVDFAKGLIEISKKRRRDRTPREKGRAHRGEERPPPSMRRDQGASTSKEGLTLGKGK